MASILPTKPLRTDPLISTRVLRGFSCLIQGIGLLFVSQMISESVGFFFGSTVATVSFLAVLTLSLVSVSFGIAMLRDRN